MALVGIEMIAQWFLANRFEVPTSQPAHVNNQRLSSLVTLVRALGAGAHNPLIYHGYARARGTATGYNRG
jgi:hypothetical protein